MWLLLPAAWAAPQLVLPVSEDPAAWAPAAALAGLVSTPGDDGVVRIVATDAAWRVEAEWQGRTRAAAIPVPSAEAEREDALTLGASLLVQLRPPELPGRTVLLTVAPVYVAPREYGEQAVGGEGAVRLRWRHLDLAGGLRLTTTRGLHDLDADQWWWPVDLKMGAGWVGGAATRVNLGVEGGVSLRGFGEDAALVQFDAKPLVGGSAALEHDIGGAWALFGRVSVDVDAGSTQIQGRGDPYELGLVDFALAVGFAWRAP